MEKELGKGGEGLSLEKVFWKKGIWRFWLGGLERGRFGWGGM